MSEFEAASLLLAKLSFAVSALSITGIVLAFVVLRRDIRKDRASRTIRLQDKGREAWLDYLNLCLANPDLDVFDIPIAKAVGDDGQIGRKEQIVIARWFGMVSQTYTTSNETDEVPDGNSAYVNSPEWHGWIRRFTNRRNFQAVWSEIKGGYDRDFITWMESNFLSHNDSRS